MKTKPIEFDRLQMYFGEPYEIAIPEFTPIRVLQPTIGDIVRIGEKRFYGTLNVFITNTTSYRLPLWESGIDWNEITNFQLFMILYGSIDPEVASLLFSFRTEEGEDKVLDFSKFEMFQRTLEGEEVTEVLYDKENNILIDEYVHSHFSQYLQTVFAMKPEEKLTTSETMKKWFIEKDKRQQAIDEKKKEKGKIDSTSLQTTISACVNHPGFKYRLKELKDVGVCEFYDSVKRLQIYESSTALMKGMYSGFVDSSKIPAESYNFMREI